MWQATSNTEGAESDEESHGSEMHGVIRPRTESARDKIAFRYLREWISEFKPATLNRSAFPADPAAPLPKPRSCGDVSLTGFAQLAALRFGVRRCLISIITTSTEYVLVEATRSISLSYDNIEDVVDAPWLGTCSFPTRDGINYSQMHAFRKARRLREVPDEAEYYYKDGSSGHYRIVSDVRDRDDLQASPFFERGKQHRFVFSVPLRDPKGVPLGALTMMDDKPRYGISAAEMALAEDLSDTVVRHLDSVVVRCQQRRGERLIQGLGLFNDDKDSLREWWSVHNDERLRKAGRHRVVGTLNKEDRRARRARADVEFGYENDSTAIEANVRPMTRRVRISTTNELSNRQATSLAHQYQPTSTRATDQRSEATHRPKLTRDLPTAVRSMSSDTATLADAATRSKQTTEAKRDFNMVKEVALTYARACNLLREGLDVEGVIFLDASAISARHAKRDQPNANRFRPGTETRSTPTSGVSGGELAQTSDTEDGGQSVPLSKSCGYSARVRSSTPSDPALPIQIPQDFLAHLIKSYPRGKVWNFNEGGQAYRTSSGEDFTTTASSGPSGAERKRPRTRDQRDAEKLAVMLRGAKAIALYPIFDSTADRWRSAGLIWTTTQDRLFDASEDLQYLAAFGACIVNKLSQLETVAADRTKSAFIGSISHELRSPLHGILAGVEFLQESELTTFQMEMANMISMAGRTLLDTVNHILDYSKVTSFTQAQRTERVVNDGARRKTHSSEGHVGEVGVTTDLDLARLTEDVLESVVSAYRFRERGGSTVSPIHEENQPPSSPVSESTSLASFSGKRNSEVAVILNIDRASSWFLTISSGSWTRVLTNLVGNALKYTREGSISVSLQFIETPHTSEDDSARLKLTVQDTGVGMSRSFVEHDLYTPFKQEDSHATGTVLGLSIVKQICRDMRADIRFDSEKGRGTTATVELELPSAAGTASKYDLLQDLSPRRMHLCSRLAGSLDTPRAKNAQLVEESVRLINKKWLTWQTSTGPEIAGDSGPTVFAITESELHDWIVQLPSSLEQVFDVITTRGAYLLVLSSKYQSTFCEHPLPIRACFVQQPIGPAKIARIIRSSETTDWSVVGATKRKSGTRSQVSWGSGQSNKLSSFASPASHGPQGKHGYFPDSPYSRGPSDAMDSKRDTEGTSMPSEEPNSMVVSPLEAKENAIPKAHTKVLLVEDNNINMRLLIALCRKLKLEYFTAENGKEAVEKYILLHHSLFLVLTDLNMPLLDGTGAARKIRQFENRERLPRCNITALSGVTDTAAQDEAKAAGIDSFLTKPISMKDLQALIQDLKGDHE
nr:hypothetical protein B0A51_03099 [Rachicladosporium sp. CCFEE 5018]